MILNSLDNKNLEKDFFKILIFDYIIGNTDRHSNNWAIIRKENNEMEIAPLYDNGSALCSYVYEEEIEKYFGKDKLLLNSLVRSKSRSMIKIDEKDKKRPMHIEVIKYLHNKYNDETVGFVETILKRLNEDKIVELINQLEGISYNRKRLLKMFLDIKLKDLKCIYEK